MVEAECIMLVSFSFHFFLFFKRKFNMLLPFCFYMPILLFFLKYVFALLLFSSIVMFYPLIEDVLFLTIFSEKSHSTMLFMFFFVLSDWYPKFTFGSLVSRNRQRHHISPTVRPTTPILNIIFFFLGLNYKKILINFISKISYIFLVPMNLFYF